MPKKNTRIFSELGGRVSSPKIADFITAFSSAMIGTDRNKKKDALSEFSKVRVNDGYIISKKSSNLDNLSHNRFIYASQIPAFNNIPDNEFDSIIALIDG